MNDEYNQFLTGIRETILRKRSEAEQAINHSQLALVCDIEQRIKQSQEAFGWDESVAEQLSKDLQGRFTSKNRLSTLEFLGIRELVLEQELERQLLARLKEFLLELGYGFTFVGDQYTLHLGEKNYRVDLLFFHRKLQCLVAFDLKTGGFKPEYAGKMNFYLELLDEQVRLPKENPSIGVILCAEKDDLEVEYALRISTKPMGVAEYQLSQQLPKELFGQLPSPEELREELKKAKR